MEFIIDCRECIYGYDCPCCYHKNNAACLTIRKNKYSLFEEFNKYMDEHAEEIVDKWIEDKLENMVDIKDIIREGVLKFYV